VTTCSLTAANVSDATIGIALLEDEAPGLHVLADGAYGSGDTLAAFAASTHRAAIKPFLTGGRSNGRFGRDDFSVDEQAGTVPGPAGNTVTISPRRTADVLPLCGTCPLRIRYTSSVRGRKLALHRHYALLVESRQG
jgi:hypothetical protein